MDKIKIIRRAPKANENAKALASRLNGFVKVKVLDNDPIPAIIAAIGAFFAAKILENVLESGAEGVTRPATAFIDYMSKIAAYEANKPTVLDLMISATKSPIFVDEAGDGSFVNIDVDTIKEVFDKVIKATIVASAYISEDAGEIAMESVQEAFSNAVYYGIGGAYATWAAYRVGLAPPNDFFTGSEFMLFDPVTRANLDALVGMNVYTTTAQEMNRLANEFVESYARSDALEMLTRLFTLVTDPELHVLAGLFRIYDTIPDYVVEIVRAHLAVLQRRVVDAMNEVSSAWADYNAQLISHIQMANILVDAVLEAKEIQKLADDIFEVMDRIVDDIGTIDTELVANVGESIRKLEEALTVYWMLKAREFEDYITTLRQARRRVKSTGLKWTIYYPSTQQQDEFTW